MNYNEQHRFHLGFARALVTTDARSGLLDHSVFSVGEMNDSARGHALS